MAQTAVRPSSLDSVMEKEEKEEVRAGNRRHLQFLGFLTRTFSSLLGIGQGSGSVLTSAILKSPTPIR